MTTFFVCFKFSTFYNENKKRFDEISGKKIQDLGHFFRFHYYYHQTFCWNSLNRAYQNEAQQNYVT